MDSATIVDVVKPRVAMTVRRNEVCRGESGGPSYTRKRSAERLLVIGLNNSTLDQALPDALEKVVQKNLATGETVLVRLKGAVKEALICTDRRVMIVKSGFMTGQMFGSSVFQLPYGGIASAEVKYRILSGYFEVSAGGMQNTAKSYWDCTVSTV